MEQGQINVLFMFCTFALVLKVMLTTMYQGKFSIQNNQRTKEDYDTFKIKIFEDAQKQEKPDKEIQDNAYRWSRIVMNDLENIPYGIAIFWAGYLVNTKSLVLGFFFLLFAVARIGHTICYAKGKQPWRTVFYIQGQFCMVIGAFIGMISAVLKMNEESTGQVVEGVSE